MEVPLGFCAVERGVSSLLFSVSILAETEEIQQLLQSQGIDSETLEDIHPIRVQPSRVLSHIYARLGKISVNRTQGLTYNIS